ncbi:MAG: hypothetical protein PUA74_09655 [Clostridiales bacterium]|nr:hypothetical protein [Clostridiales bacterium]
MSTKGTTTVNVQKTLTRFFFDEAGAKKKLGKKKAPQGDFAACGRRQGLCALDLLKKAGENFFQSGESHCFGLKPSGLTRHNASAPKVFICARQLPTSEFFLLRGGFLRFFMIYCVW